MNTDLKLDPGDFLSTSIEPNQALHLANSASGDVEQQFKVVKILKRPAAVSSNLHDDTIERSSSSASLKSFEEREAAYVEARQRIFGASNNSSPLICGPDSTSGTDGSDSEGLKEESSKTPSPAPTKDEHFVILKRPHAVLTAPRPQLQPQQTSPDRAASPLQLRSTSNPVDPTVSAPMLRPPRPQFSPGGSKQAQNGFCVRKPVEFTAARSPLPSMERPSLVPPFPPPNIPGSQFNRNAPPFYFHQPPPFVVAQPTSAGCRGSGYGTLPPDLEKYYFANNQFSARPAVNSLFMNAMTRPPPPVNTFQNSPVPSPQKQSTPSSSGAAACDNLQDTTLDISKISFKSGESGNDEPAPNVSSGSNCSPIERLLAKLSDVLPLVTVDKPALRSLIEPLLEEIINDRVSDVIIENNQLKLDIAELQKSFAEKDSNVLCCACCGNIGGASDNDAVLAAVGQEDPSSASTRVSSSTSEQLVSGGNLLSYNPTTEINLGSPPSLPEDISNDPSHDSDNLPPKDPS